MTSLKIENRLDLLFKQQRKEPLLSIFYTAGYPHLEDTVPIAKATQAAGANLIEIGIPFSDPIADGPTIQASSKIALDQGMNLRKLMTQLQTLRYSVTMPVLLMGYLNPIMQYGIKKFCSDCKACGIDGLIIPDLPFDIYQREYQSIFEKNNLHYISLITPQTSDERILKIDQASSGFLYAVSSASTTGGGSQIQDAEDYLIRLNTMKLRNPVLVGFNIKSYEDLQFVGRYHDGGIIGSAFIRAITDQNDVIAAGATFIHSLKNKS
ncbi:UNVERIFIED_CONTAM: hypothetical protein GTU68_050390 [Idotea baltica]|nr:hypothetical protein [Idotea baltica]